MTMIDSLIRRSWCGEDWAPPAVPWEEVVEDMMMLSSVVASMKRGRELVGSVGLAVTGN